MPLTDPMSSRMLKRSQFLPEKRSSNLTELINGRNELPPLSSSAVRSSSLSQSSSSSSNLSEASSSSPSGSAGSPDQRNLILPDVIRTAVLESGVLRLACLHSIGRQLALIAHQFHERRSNSSYCLKSGFPGTRSP